MMSLMLKRNLPFVSVAFILSFASFLPSVGMPSIVHKQGSDIFKKLRKWQQVYSDVKFTDLKANLNDNFLTQFRNKYESKFEFLCKVTPFLQILTNGQINEFGYQLKPPLDKQFAEKMAIFYDLFESNLPEFINFLKQNNFSTVAINDEEMNSHYDYVINKYNAFIRLLIPDNGGFLEEQALFALGNRFFEYCFESKTAGHYQELLGNTQYYPMARFLNAIIWYQLIGDGWKHWHQNCLDALKERYDKGHEIVCLAGGTDIYQLLRAGIYKIRVIDPFLPSKERYCTLNYMWLLKGAGPDGGLGDEISMAFEKRHIILKRELYTESEDKFFSKISSDDKIVEIKKSVTTWKIYDLKNNVLGSVVFERRLVDQADFNNLTDKTLVFSYNDIAASVVPEILNGRGIDPTKLADDVLVFVKQLRKPVTKDVLCQMRVVSMMNLADLKFINLVSEPA